MFKLLVFIPAYNEEKNVGNVIRDIPKNISGVSEIMVVVVDDGSTDNTVKVAENFGAKVIRNHFNMGLGVTFDRGLQYAIENDFDAMVSIDGDGQFDPGDISVLVELILSGDADLVTASRFVNRDFYPEMPWIKFWGNKTMSYFISKLTGARFYDVSCGFRAYSREALLSLNLHGEFTYTHETFLNLAFKRLSIKEVPVSVSYFADRHSRVASNVFIYGLRTLRIILRTYQDYKPLSFFSRIGSIFFLSAVFFESILLFTYLKSGTFSPHIWSGFVGAVFLFISIIFFIIGIFADMTARIRLNQEKILYHIKKQKATKRSRL